MVGRFRLGFPTNNIISLVVTSQDAGIFTYMWLIFIVNVGPVNYLPYMDGMGFGTDKNPKYFLHHSAGLSEKAISELSHENNFHEVLVVWWRDPYFMVWNNPPTTG